MMLQLRRKNRAPIGSCLEQLERRIALTVLVPTTFANAGASFNDSTRTLEGGLYQLDVAESNQPTGTVNRYVNDLKDVRDTINAERAVGGDLNNVSTTTNTHLNTIVADLTRAINNAPASVSAANAQAAVRNAQIGILNIVQNDATLLAAATTGGAVGFQQVPQLLPDGVTAQTAPHQNLAQIGAIYNDAANRLLGGVTPGNVAAIKADLAAVRQDTQDLIADNPDLFGGLTGIHADVIVRQMLLELDFVNQVGIDPAAAKGLSDIQLDIIDIVQGDTNLANMANQDGIAGFAVFPPPLTAPKMYLDSQDQTLGLATFIAQSNALGQQAIALITNNPGDTEAIQDLIQQLQIFRTNTTNFVLAQGLIFQARFDNELRGGISTNGADVAAMIKGLTDGNIDLVTAAAEALHTNAADVAGNNIPATISAYNVDGTTVAEVLSPPPA